MTRRTFIAITALLLTIALAVPVAAAGPAVYSSADNPGWVGVDSNDDGSDDMWIELTAQDPHGWRQFAALRMSTTDPVAAAPTVVYQTLCDLGIVATVRDIGSSAMIDIETCFAVAWVEEHDVFRVADMNGDGDTSDPGEFSVIREDLGLPRLTGERIRFSSVAEYPAEEAFYTAPGLACAPGVCPMPAEDSTFTLTLDGVEQRPIELTRAHRGELVSRTWLFNYPDGLPAGPHTFEWCFVTSFCGTTTIDFVP